MGWSCTFLLIRDGDPEDVAARLGGRLGSEEFTAEQATTGEAPGPTVGPLVNGWLVVTDRNIQVFEDALVAGMSRSGQILAYFIEEHVMTSSAISWRDGIMEWSLTYDEGKLTATGDVPGVPDGEGDEFDAPADVIHSLTGWSYDDEHEGLPFRPILGLPAERPKRRRRWARRRS
ncbi:MAG TPA: hypothetical protein VH912_26860 [Streptosporangiaceae bacterium]|jgi:hypothetical protein